jgi:hypothetical protein
MTRLTSPRHSYTERHKKYSSQPSPLPLGVPLICSLNHRLVVSTFMHIPPLDFHILHRFQFFLTHASDRPAFPEFTKSNPREAHPTLSNKLSSRKHKLSQVEGLGSLREVVLFGCIKIIELYFFPCLANKLIPCLCVVVLF